MKRLVLIGLVLLLPGCTSQTEMQTADEPERNQPVMADNDKESSLPEEESPEVIAARTEELQEQLWKFVASPNRDVYLKLRKQVIESKTYDPYSDEFEIVQQLLVEHQFEKARDFLQKSMSNLLLSPRAHILLGTIHAELENAERASAEQSAADACIQGILATGDGSESLPYIVLRKSDEIDVIRHLKLAVGGQQLENKDNRYFDVIDCGSGSEIWFDITDVMKKLGKAGSD